jgi:S-DNA-T family DNA segregation ATPase FtsK/SpoIIIE
MYHIIMENRHGSSRSAKNAGSAKAAPSKHILSEVSSIFIFALCLFVLIALLTYNPADPSIFSNIKGQAHNACGRVGSSLAAVVLQGFGMGAFLLPAALFFISAGIHKREGFTRFIGTLGGMTVAVMAFTVFLSLHWQYWPYSGSLILTGGAFGAWVSELLVRSLNPLGSSILSICVFALAIAVSTPLSVAHFGARVIRFTSAFTWRFTKLIGTYLLYLGGLLAMRTAHTAGDVLQKLIEGAIARARAQKEARREMNEAKRKLELEMKSQPELPAPSEGEKEEDQEHENVAETDSEAETETDAVLAAASSEAPNALPELESKKIAPLSPGKPSSLTILPRETSANEETEKSAEPSTRSKLLSKLSSRARKSQWKLPAIEFLRKPPKIESAVDREKLISNSQILKQKFADFGIDGEVTAVRPGPVITLYEFKPGPGVKVSRIAALADDLSMALSAQSVRILAPLPGKSVVGIEIPSDTRETVYLREFLQNQDFYGQKHAIPVVMGKDIGGQTYLSDLARMPHLLCAGQTGAGKSVFMNGLICSLFYRFTPDELRMILVDPKFIEFRSYQDIPHLLLPVVDDPKQASIALKWAVREMERRYRILAKVGARNLASFNQKLEDMGSDVIHDLLLSEENQSESSGSSASTAAGSDWMEAFEPDESGAPRVGKLPYIVVIIDELADLMMIAKKEVEISIARIAQKARAAGIHLIIATQRPSTDVVTGLIKANLPSRVSFQLASYIDSKTILDRSGAERLLGQGDMLFIPPGGSQTVRLHGAFVDDEEIEKITSFLRSQGKPAYRDEILISDEEDEDSVNSEGEDHDALFEEAVELVKRSGHASASFLQRHLKVGYNRAARMIENMEAKGIVGPPDGARPREVLMR